MSNSKFYTSAFLSLSLKIIQALGMRRGGDPGTQRSLLWEILLPEASLPPLSSALVAHTQPLSAGALGQWAVLWG